VETHHAGAFYHPMNSADSKRHEFGAGNRSNQLRS
jgi:hypothetical protein